MDITLCRFTPGVALPVRFPSPFNISPHPLAVQACELLQQRLPDLCSSLHNFDEANGGKMMGALVVETADGGFAYLSAYSGMLGGQWCIENFVPPVFDLNERNAFLPTGEQQLKALGQQLLDLELSESYRSATVNVDRIQQESRHVLSELKNSQRERRQQRLQARLAVEGSADNTTDCSASQSREINKQLDDQSRQDKAELKQQRHYWKEQLAVARAGVGRHHSIIENVKLERQSLSRNLQRRVFEGYRLLNGKHEQKSLGDFFPGAMPPGGSGDCVAIKLLQACFNLRLNPVCLGEFWWGASPTSGVRHHGRYYPACRGKCRPLLPFMLSGLEVTLPDHERPVYFPDSEPQTIYEDEHLLVIEKPAGMLSVPGKVLSDSVETRLRGRYVKKGSNLLVHRLDQATSGLLLAARSDAIRTCLQQQFQQRKVEKQYTAVVAATNVADCGQIELPLRTDIDDRPRQCVCALYGKPSLTRYKVTERFEDKTRIAFFPVTGRTHQLRVHAAHPDGLNAPIIGDDLYGAAAGNRLRYDTGTRLSRLHLHAERIGFTHPVSGQFMSFSSVSPF